MTESADAPADTSSAREVVARTSHDGTAVRKVATMHGSDAVAVYFSIRSTRESRCTVRIVDDIPERLRGHDVEFHPKYDPVNWTMADGSVVYAATIPADSSRTTVYGVAVEDPSQLQLFTAEPTVEITDRKPSEPTGEPVGAGAAFSFEEAEGPVDTPSRAASETDPASQPVESRPDRTKSSADEGESPVDSLVTELRRRELTRAERRALRGALDLEDADSVNARLSDLREEVEALRDEVATVDRQATAVDRIESRTESLATELEELRDTVSKEVSWRSKLRDSLTDEPGLE